jgi:hypothetical protein
MRTAGDTKDTFGGERGDMELQNNSALQNGLVIMCAYAKSDINVKVRKIRSNPAV